MLAFYLTLVDTPEDKDFLEYVYEEYRQFMFVVAKDVLDDESEAEDAVHEAFLRIIEVIDKLKEYDKDHLRASVLVTTKNVALNIAHRREKFEYVGLFNEETETNLCAVDDVNIEASVLKEIEFNEVLGYVRKLTVEEQDLLYMHYVHSTPGKDLAVMFGISPASVRKKIERACKKLEKLIEEDGYGK